MATDQQRLAELFSQELTKAMYVALDAYKLSFPRLQKMRSEFGDIETAKRLVSQNGASSGFIDLLEAQRLDLTIENLVIDKRFEPLFTDQEIKMARRRLGR